MRSVSHEAKLMSFVQTIPGPGTPFGLNRTTEQRLSYPPNFEKLPPSGTTEAMKPTIVFSKPMTLIAVNEEGCDADDDASTKLFNEKVTAKPRVCFASLNVSSVDSTCARVPPTIKAM